MKKLNSVILILMLFFTLTACNKNAKNTTDNTTTYENETATSVYKTTESQSTENTQTLCITNAKNFVDGYACLELKDSNDKEYYAFIDSSGNVTYYMEKGVKFCNIYKNGNFYFSERINGGYIISCIRYDGQKIYEHNFPIDNSISKYSEPIFGDDGTLLICREYGGFERSGTQLAYIDAYGNFVQDWEYIDINGNYADYASAEYCGNGFVYVYATYEDVKTNYIYNFNNHTRSIVEGITDPDASEIMNGHFLLGGGGEDYYVISSDGKTVAKIPWINWRKYYLHEQYQTESSDGLVFNEQDSCLYNSTLTNVIAHVPIPTTSKESFIKGTFKNGYALLVMLGADERYYVTLINNKGEFQFEPIFIKEKNAIAWDGEHFTIADNSSLSRLSYKYISFYDKTGKMVYEIDFKNYSQSADCFATSEISEGFVILNDRSSEEDCKGYLKYDGTILFPDGTIQVKY